MWSPITPRYETRSILWAVVRLRGPKIRLVPDNRWLLIDRKVIESISSREKYTLIFSPKLPVIFFRQQTFILSHKCLSLSKRHLIAHRNLQALLTIEARVKDKCFCGSQTAILRRHLHILLRRAWLRIQRDRKRNKQIQKEIFSTTLLYLNNPAGIHIQHIGTFYGYRGSRDTEIKTPYNHLVGYWHTAASWLFLF